MAAVALKYPSLPEVWGTADGLNLDIQSTKDDRVQSMFYNGWTHGHYVSSVLVFGFDGVIKICGLNAPGNMHDSLLADYAGVYEKQKAVRREGDDDHRKPLQTTHGKYSIEDIFFASSHAWSGSLYHVSLLTVNGE